MKHGSWFLGFAAIGLLGVAGCASTGPNAAGGGGDTASGALSAAEEDGLLFSREEEKLARDVYAVLDAQHPAFSNIREAEQQHMDAIAVLLDRYELDDPADGLPAGAFTNGDLATLYDALTTRGSASTIAALEVGAEIEELDLEDLARLQASVEHRDLNNTYDNLARGSRNHLRAFYGALVDLGGTYAPKHISQEDFDAIVATSVERGGR